MNPVQDLIDQCLANGLTCSVINSTEAHPVIVLQPTERVNCKWMENLNESSVKLKELTGWNVVVVGYGISILDLQSDLMKSMESRIHKLEEWIKQEDTRALEESEY